MGYSASRRRRLNTGASTALFDDGLEFPLGVGHRRVEGFLRLELIVEVKTKLAHLAIDCLLDGMFRSFRRAQSFELSPSHSE
jgi:hypothetical protein